MERSCLNNFLGSKFFKGNIMKKLILIIACLFIMSCSSIPQKIIIIEEHFQENKKTTIKEITNFQDSSCKFLIKDSDGILWYIFISDMGKIKCIEKIIFYK